MEIKVHWNDDWEQELLQRLEKDGPWGDWGLHNIALKSEQALHIPSFEEMQAPKFLPSFTPLPHQLEVARQVVQEMNGKAILADEVGLGKTIEAGLILKEYMVRGLVKKVLLLVPASLVSQWTTELISKFHIPAIMYRKSYNWSQVDVMVTSLDTVKRATHQEEVLAQSYDLVIIDEAHKLKNHKTKNYAFIQKLKKRFCLLLTATPVQNRIEEIFNLVSLLKPGHLGNLADFADKYDRAERSLQQEAHLKELINKVMIRNRREDTGIEWTKRHVETVTIDMKPAQRKLYDELSTLRKGDTGLATGFSYMTLQREACSSREAVYMTLQNMIKKQETPSEEMNIRIQPLLSLIEEATENAKAEKMVELIKQIDDKVIVFTEYRATQLYLQWFLQQHGITSVPFRGGFKRGKKDWMRELFRSKAQVLIATEAGGEGINLQFCHNIINFDLPWNPMRLEQRIGRIHRLGQEEDVRIYNFATKDTVEEHILKLLHEKIELFKRVVGELDDILTQLEFGTVDDHFTDIFHHSQSEGEMRIKIANLESMVELAEQMKGESTRATAGNS